MRRAKGDERRAVRAREHSVREVFVAACSSRVLRDGQADLILAQPAILPAKKNSRPLEKRAAATKATLEIGGNAGTAANNRNSLQLLVLQIAQAFSLCMTIAGILYQLYKNLTIPFEMGYVGGYKGLV
jgi:hypothetical protein